VIINLYIFNRQDKNFIYLRNIVKSKIKNYLYISRQLFFEKLENLKENILAYVFYQGKILENIPKNRRIYNYIKINLENSSKKIISNEKKKRLLY
jgi:hypothetical protein